MAVGHEKSCNSLELLRNTLVIGLAADVLLSSEDAADTIRGITVRLPRQEIPLDQVARALADPAARAQLRSEFTKLVFRSVLSDSFEIAVKWLRFKLGESGLDQLSWYWFAKVVRNALDHGSKISVRETAYRKRLPISWRGLEINAASEGARVDDLIDHSHAIELIGDMIEDVRRHSPDA